MPPATRRRQRHHRSPSPSQELLVDAASETEVITHEDAAALAAGTGADFTDVGTGDEEGEEDEEEHGDGEEGDNPEQDEGDDGTQDAGLTSAPPLPPNLKEISSLASWTVSTSKPGCGVAQLRAPSTALFWQSDGPQPHTLNIHFFKLVGIAALRIYLDFDQDESYTPTRIAFLAGTGPHDLQEFAAMSLEQPRGWLDVDFGNVGEADDDRASDDDVGAGDRLVSIREGYLHDDEMDVEDASETDEEDSDEDDDDDEVSDEDISDEDPVVFDDNDQDEENRTGQPAAARSQPRSRPRKGRRRRPAKNPILRAFLVQVKILENHQNGKDTHLRGLQIFARDKTAARVAPIARAPEASAKPVELVSGPGMRPSRPSVALPDWGVIPELR